MYPVALYTLGCKLNQLESEAIADSFRKAGFPLVSSIDSADPALIIINTCTVTSKADQKCRRLIRKALRDYPDSCVIVTGCYAHLDPAEIKLLEAEAGSGAHRLFVAGSNSIGTSGTSGTTGAASAGSAAAAGAAKSSLLDLPEYVRKAANDTPKSPLSRILESWVSSAAGSETFAFKPEEFLFHSRGYLKIQDGCDNSCSYCRVRLARGPSVSLPPEAALAQVRSFEERDCAELMITGVNITQYRYCGRDLAGLLEYLLEGSSSIAFRLSSLEPECIDQRLASALAHPRVRPHFHLSVQSGSDDVLRAMGRAYTSQAAGEGAALLRSVKDNPFLACDIIAGFPGETEAAFRQTLDLCAAIRFAWIHAFPYSKRPGTDAFSLNNPVCERDAAQRVQLLTKLAIQNRRDYAQSWLGRELSAVVEKGRCSGGQCRAVSENYLKLMVNCSGECSPGASIRCTPVSLCEKANGEEPDAIAVMGAYPCG